ncbi:MAG: isochorismatase [Puniceicoccaceae bacterium MED-G31]|nr:MAG: isochorismatase [Puniceicoccaceae bacterium MED-G31]
MINPTEHLGLLIIDLQSSLISKTDDEIELLNRCSFAIQAALLLQCKVAVTEQSPTKLGSICDELRRILPEEIPVFSKDSFSAMDSSGIKKWIGDNQIEHLLLIGLESSICIYQTAVAALGEDIGVTLLSDCIAERRIEDRQPVIQQLLSMDAHVLPSETIFYSLVGSAENPIFSEFTKLVKQYS